MPDEFQSEERSLEAAVPGDADAGDAIVSSTPIAAAPEANIPESIETDGAAPQARVPAATASSYRDIIAERLARKVSGNQAESTRSPMAHSADVERAVIPPLPVKEEVDKSQGNDSISPEIESATRLQEIPAITGAVSERGTK